MTTPTRRIRNARLRYPRSHAAARACVLTASLRSKDIVLRAVARAGDDAMLAADALRLERDAAHEECARLSVSGVVFRNIARVFEGLYASAEADLASADTIAARLVEVICEDAERIATLTAERDHARGIAVALEQGLTVDTRVPMDSDRTPEVEG